MDENKKDLSEGVKKLFLAGVGAANAAKEKSKEILGDLVEKGEQVVSQNEGLKDKLNEAGEKAKSAGEKAISAGEKAISAIKETAERFTSDQSGKMLDFSELLERLNPEQLAALKEQIARKEADEEEIFCEAAMNISEEDKADEEGCCEAEKKEDEACCCETEKKEDEAAGTDPDSWTSAQA